MKRKIGWGGWREIGWREIKETKETTEKRRKREEMFWRIAATALLMLFCVVAILTAGCGDNRINPASATGPSTTGTTGTTLDSSNDADLKLVKEYNSDYYGGKATKWTKSVVTVYDSTGQISNLQSILNDWNAVLNGKLTLVVSSGSGGDIEIIKGNVQSCSGYVYNTTYSGIFYGARIEVNLDGCNPGNWLIEQEIGHTIGIEHILDGGIMDSTLGSNRMTITIISMTKKLYSDSVPAGATII